MPGCPVHSPNWFSSRKCHWLNSIFKRVNGYVVSGVVTTMPLKLSTLRVDSISFYRLIGFRRKQDFVNGRGLGVLYKFLYQLCAVCVCQSVYNSRALRVRRCVFSCVRSMIKNSRRGSSRLEVLVNSNRPLNS